MPADVSRDRRERLEEAGMVDLLACRRRPANAVAGFARSRETSPRSAILRDMLTSPCATRPDARTAPYSSRMRCRRQRGTAARGKTAPSAKPAKQRAERRACSSGPAIWLLHSVERVRSASRARLSIFFAAEASLLANAPQTTCST